MQEKSKGILAYATNTKTVDYVSIAKATLSLASAQLNLPYTLVTPPAETNWQNYRTDIDTQTTVPWNNYNRYMCFEHSPYDQTIVIDVDYLVLTPKLNLLFDTKQHMLFCHHNQFLHQSSVHAGVVQPVWATVFYFTKNKKSEAFFQLVGKIQRNWQFYRTLFSVPQPQFRNDYAFAIAELIISGYSLSSETRMPWHILTVDKTPEEIQVNKNWIVLRDRDNAVAVPRQDIHVMSKSWLQSDSLGKFIAEAQS